MLRTTTVPSQLAAQDSFYIWHAVTPSRVDRVALRSVSPANFITKLLVLVAFAAASVLAIAFTGYPLRLTFQLVLGALIAHATELVHQCLHRTAIGKERWDSLLGRLLGLPSATSFHYYRWFHLWHHKYNGTELDKESFDYAYQLMGHRSRLKRLFGFARHLSMIGHYINTLKRVSLAMQGRLASELVLSNPEMRFSAARQIQQDYRLIGGLMFLIVVVSLLLRSSVVLPLWIVPLALGWGPIHALIELPEHWRCDRPEANVFLNTRSIDASAFARWFTNNNCNHVAHHFDMSIPLERLPAFEKTLVKKSHFKYHERSYLSFYRQFFRFLWNGPSLEPSRRISIRNE